MTNAMGTEMVTQYVSSTRMHPTGHAEEHETIPNVNENNAVPLSHGPSLLRFDCFAVEHVGPTASGMYFSCTAFCFIIVIVPKATPQRCLACKSNWHCDETSVIRRPERHACDPLVVRALCYSPPPLIRSFLTNRTVIVTNVIIHHPEISVTNFVFAFYRSVNPSTPGSRRPCRSTRRAFNLNSASKPSGCATIINFDPHSMP